jgi:hypothetical protein
MSDPPAKAAIPGTTGLFGAPRIFHFRLPDRVLEVGLPRIASGITAKLKLQEQIGTDPAQICLICDSRIVPDRTHMWGLPSDEMVVNVVSPEVAIVAFAVSKRAGSPDLPILPQGANADDAEELENKVIKGLTSDELELVRSAKPDGVSEISAVLTYLQSGRDIGITKLNLP